MKHPAIHPILKSRFEKIQAAFDRTLHGYACQDIHAFRIEVKKLRAFLQLAAGEHPIQLPKHLHKFYGMAGLVRNLELQQQRILDAFKGKPQLPQSYLNSLGIESAVASLAARAYAQKKLSVRQEKNDLLARAPAHLRQTGIHHFLNNTDKRLRAAVALLPPLSDEALHDVRKCLKDLQYNLPYINEEAAHLLPAALLKRKDHLVHLTEALGRYQDLRAALTLLTPGYLQQVNDDKEKLLLETLRTSWEADKQAAGIHLHTLLTRMFSHTPKSPSAADPILEVPFTT